MRPATQEAPPVRTGLWPARLPFYYGWVNVVIAAALIFVIHEAVTLDQLESIENPRVELLAKLAWVNIMLVLFNLIPAFPMDGGRVLRAKHSLRDGQQLGVLVQKRCGGVVGVGHARHSACPWA